MTDDEGGTDRHARVRRATRAENEKTGSALVQNGLEGRPRENMQGGKTKKACGQKLGGWCRCLDPGGVPVGVPAAVPTVWPLLSRLLSRPWLQWRSGLWPGWCPGVCFLCRVEHCSLCVEDYSVHVSGSEKHALPGRLRAGPGSTGQRRGRRCLLSRRSLRAHPAHASRSHLHPPRRPA